MTRAKRAKVAESNRKFHVEQLRRDAVRCDLALLRQVRATNFAGHNAFGMRSVQKMHVDGSLIECGGLNRWRWADAEHKRGDRKAIREFSKRSRRAMLHTVARIPSELRPLLITLTYPGEWPEDPRRWKRDLDTFGKRLIRQHPTASMVWKLEPQDRGAPHYHGVLYGPEWVNMDWLAFAWWTVVGSGDLKHLGAGTRIERAREAHAAVAYAAKCYACKVLELPPGWEAVGRFWGVVGRGALPRSAVVDVSLTERQTVTWRRLLRRWARGKGLRVPDDGTFGLLSMSMPAWIRCLERISLGDFCADAKAWGMVGKALSETACTHSHPRAFKQAEGVSSCRPERAAAVAVGIVSRS